MKKNLSKTITIILSLALVIGTCACNKKKNEKGINDTFPTWWVHEQINSTDEELYVGLVGLRNDIVIPQKICRTYEDMEKYAYILDALTWQMKKYSDDKNKKYHVLIQYFDVNEDPDHDGSIPKEIVDNINEKYNTSFNLEDWIKVDTMMGFQYYYLFTAEEIFALANSEIYCRYVGSGEGDIADVNFDTEEGIATFFELYGDGIIQYKDGMKIYY